MEVPQKINVHLSYDTAVTDSPRYGVAVCVCVCVFVCVCVSVCVFIQNISKEDIQKANKHMKK